MKRALRSLWPWTTRAATEPAPDARPAAAAAREDSDLDERIDAWLSGSVERDASS